MTAKSKMVYGRLLSLGGKGRLIVIRHACSWQNAPVQILVTYPSRRIPTAPLRTDRKYVYRKIKLHVYKITRYTKKTALYPIVYQRLTNAFLKGAFLPCKRASFTVPKLTCYFQCMNLYYNPSNALVPFITREYLSLCIIITTQ